jgi:hypothetical protein
MNINQEKEQNEETFLDFGAETKDGKITPGFRTLKFGGYLNEEKKLAFESGVTGTGTKLVRVYISNNNHTVGDSFFLSSVAMPKLKNLYFELFGEHLNKSFKTVQELVDFLNEKFYNIYTEDTTFNLKVAGEKNGIGVTYCQLPFKNVIIKDKSFVDRDFTEKEALYFIKQKR